MSVSPSMPSNKVEQFMESPLVAWVKTFDDFNTVLSVGDLADGILLHKVMYTVDPNAYSMNKVNRSVGRDLALRMQNLQLLVMRIKHFYLTYLQQLVISTLPNISVICQSPESDYSLDELDRLLVLLLGCVVQCEGKVPLIERMKSMDLAQQQTLVSHIQQMTDTTEYVCSVDWNDLEEISKPNLEGLCRTAYIHLQRVAKERDHHYDTLLEVAMEKDYYKQLHQAQSGDNSLPRENGISINSPQSKSPAINAEVIELKKKCRQLQEQLDRKFEMVTDLKEDLEQCRGTISQLKQEKRELAESARSALVYRDEIETLKVQSSRVEKLEADVMKYRQKAEDTEYLKKRIAELKQQNDLMLETKALLEQKATSLTAKTEVVDELMEEMASIRVQLDSLNQEKEMDLERIEDMLAQNAQLELDARHYKDQIAELTTQLEAEKLSEVSSSGEASSLSVEMSEADLASKAKVLRLEKEAREMEKSMETLRQTQAKCSELEKTNKKLYSQTHTDRKEIIKLREEVEVLKVKASRVDKLQVELNSQRERLEEASRLSAKLKELKSRNEVILETKARLEDEVESLQSKSTLTEDLKDENASLKAQVESLTSEHEEDQKRVQELLEQNAQLELEMQRCSEEKSAVLATLEQLRSSGSHQGPVTVLSPPRISEAEMASRAKLQRLEKRLRETEKSKEELRQTQAKCAELERMNKKLQGNTHSDRKEIIRLKEELHGLQAKSDRLNKLQSEFRTQEQKLEDVDTARRKVAELKQQNALLSETKVLLQEEVSSLHNKLEKLSEVQVDNAALQVRVDTMEQEIQEENVRMQELLQQNVQLELDRDQMNAELGSLSTEIAQLKLKQLPEPREVPFSPVHPPMTEQDFATQTKLLHLERENRELDRSLQVMKQSRERTLAEMEKMNKKLTAQIHADKKEISRLKEELRRERSQHATLTRLKSVGDEQDLQQTKQFQELESKFKETYSQSLTTKDERIHVLERRVEEITEDNAQLREEVKSMKKHNERLKEMAQGTTGASGSPMGSPHMSRNNSPRELNRLREQAADAIRLREHMHRLEQENHHLAADLVESKHINQRNESTNHRLGDRIQMLEQLNQTLEEEKKTLLLQINKLLEHNQDILVKTLESKDQALEDERTFNDRLGELERDKARLSQRLIAQQREHLAMEIDFYKKSKSKNLLKRGFKKLKGKIQGRTHTFDLTETGGTSLGLPSSQQSLTASLGSPSSQGLGLPPYSFHDGSMSSSQSISSSNSGRHSDNGQEDDLDPPESGVGASGGFPLIPRGPTLDGSSVLRPRKTRSYTLPGGMVRIRRPHAASSPNIGAEITDDLMSLEDFLAESEKTPNRRRVMELKRASLILNTPPVTPRNSLLVTNVGNSGPASGTNTLDLQEFLSIYEPEELQTAIPEVEETELEPRYQDQSAMDFHPSQTSHPSTSSLHSSSQSQSNEPPPELNVDANMNNNNSNVDITVNVRLCDRGKDGPASSTPNSDTATTISWGNTSTISVSSTEPSGDGSKTQKRQLRPTKSTGDTCNYSSTLHVPLKEGENASSVKKKVGKGFPKSKSTDKLKDEPKGKGKGKGKLFQRRFHKSSETLDTDKKKVTGKPPLIKRKIHKSSADLVDQRKKEHGATTRRYSGISQESPNLAGLTDLNHKRLSLPSSSSSSRPSVLPTLSPLQQHAPSQESLSSPKSDEDSVWFEYGSV